MPSIAKPIATHPSLQRNELGLTIRDYEGAMSTLCAGCGHDSITAAIVRALWELSMQPHMIAKLSGIGCSSKTPTYFVSGAHGFNSAHGRMPPIATGANAANRELTLHRHFRRRRFALHRPRPPVPRHPPQRAHGLRHREQRRLRPHQGPVLRLRRHRNQEQEGREEPHGAHRSGHARPQPRRNFHRPQFFRRQGPARPDSQSRPGASRIRADRRDLALRDLQRSRRFDQELPLHAPARPQGHRSRLRPAGQRDSGSHRPERRRQRDHARRKRGSASKACRRTTIPRIAKKSTRIWKNTTAKAKSSRACSTSTKASRTCTK